MSSSVLCQRLFRRQDAPLCFCLTCLSSHTCLCLCLCVCVCVYVCVCAQVYPEPVCVQEGGQRQHEELDIRRQQQRHDELTFHTDESYPAADRAHPPLAPPQPPSLPPPCISLPPPPSLGPDAWGSSPPPDATYGIPLPSSFLI